MRDTPGRIVIRQNEAEGVSPLHRRDELAMQFMIVVVAVLIVGAIGAWWLAVRRRWIALPSETRAEKLLARRLGVRGSAWTSLHEVASGAGLPTLALLASPSALARALESLPPSRRGRRSVRRLAKLAQG